MVSSGCHILPQTAPLTVLMVGFPEGELSRSCHSIISSQESNLSVDRTSTFENVRAQIESGCRYQVIVLDCRQGTEAWGQVSQIAQDGQKALILGIRANVESANGQDKFLEDAIGYLVEESMALPVLKWVLQQAEGRQQLLVEQQKLREQLEEAAHHSEMVDVAATVLHNVGNVLTSVTVAANIVESVVDQSSVTLVNRMAELIKTHQEDLGTYLTEDPKGKRIPISLEKLGIHLLEEQRTILKEIQGLVKNIRHMKHIIASHQKMAKSVSKVELIALDEVLAHAMELSFQPGDVDWMTIHHQYQEIPPVAVDQHQLLQILVNVFRNAKQAMWQQAQANHELIVNVQYQDEQKSFVVITIQDSGIGIASEHLAKMCTRGFTTKPEGNGIGLHSSMMAIQNMGGSMSIHSEGIGKGAVSTLILPVQPQGVLF